MTDIEIKNLIEAQLNKSGWVVGSDGVCTADTNEEPTTETTN